jgi:hypothetical protein
VRFGDVPAGDAAEEFGESGAVIELGHLASVAQPRCGRGW